MRQLLEREWYHENWWLAFPLVPAAFAMLGSVVYALALAPPAAPVSIENPVTSIIDRDGDGRVSVGDWWRIDSTLVSRTRCDGREIERRIYFEDGSAVIPVTVDRGADVPVRSGAANWEPGSYPVWVAYEITRLIRGTYVVKQEAFGCDNGFEGAAPSLSMRFDWTSRSLTAPDAAASPPAR